MAFAISAAQLLVNDSDADNAAGQLHVSAVGQARNGVASMDAEGNVRFEPAADFHGQASFQYQVSDGEGGQTWATAYLNIASVNDAPVIEDIWYGRPVYGYRWGEDDAHVWGRQAVTDEATALALVANSTDVVRSPAGNWLPDNLMDAQGREIGIERYRNGMLRPIEYSRTDATHWLAGTPMDDPYRMNGRVVAWDPDGDSSQLAFTLAQGPQHGHAWVNQYTELSTRQGHDHTEAPFLPWVQESGAWQHYSHMGDPYGGPDRFTIRVSDAQGATTDAEVTPIHVGSEVSSSGASASVSQMALLFNQMANTAQSAPDAPIGFVPLQTDAAVHAQWVELAPQTALT